MSEDLTLDISVHEAVRRFPPTMKVFNELGIDTCCGGGMRIRDAAKNEGLNPDEVLERARQVLATDGG